MVEEKVQVNMKRFSINIVILLLLFISHTQAQFLNIKNDVFWNTKDGKPIYSQDGGIFKFKDATGKVRFVI